HRVGVVDVPRPGHFEGKLDVTIRQQVIIFAGDGSAGLGPLLQVTELYPQNCALQALHPVVISAQNVMIFAILSPIAEHANCSRVVGIARGDGATLAVSAKILRRIKTEAGDVTDASDLPPFIFRAVRLRRVLDYDQSA